MTHFQKRLASAALVGGLLLCATRAEAQFGGPINPYTPNGTVPLTPNPFAINPYAPGGSGYPGTGYGWNPGEFGGILFGHADMLRAYGATINMQEQARILRQQSIQARFDTQRKRFELEMYIKANTPTFTEEQAKVARTTLQRIKTNSTPAEITTGKSLNLILDDARNFKNRKVASDSTPLSEGVLMQLNVTANENGMGPLRDGQINWPIALKEVLTDEQRRTLEAQAQALVQGAAKGKVDANTLRDFGGELDRAYEMVLERVNELGPHYLDAKRFLSDLRNARKAIEKGEAQHQAEFMRWVSTGGKTVQDVVDYLISKGLKFAPASLHDEAAYRAFFSALVAYNVALNAHAGDAAAPPEKQ
jgi:hypothetical protein